MHRRDVINNEIFELPREKLDALGAIGIVASFFVECDVDVHRSSLAVIFVDYAGVLRDSRDRRAIAIWFNGNNAAAVQGSLRVAHSSVFERGGTRVTQMTKVGLKFVIPGFAVEATNFPGSNRWRFKFDAPDNHFTKLTIGVGNSSFGQRKIKQNEWRGLSNVIVRDNR